MTIPSGTDWDREATRRGKYREVFHLVTRGAPSAQETRQAKLTAADGATGDNFGWSVAREKIAEFEKVVIEPVTSDSGTRVKENSNPG